MGSWAFPCSMDFDMKMKTVIAKDRINGINAFGRIPFRTMESRLAGAEWMNHTKGLMFRFLPSAPIIRI